MLTEKEVKERATTPEKALDVSIQHHEENLTLSGAEIRKIYDDGGVILGITLCGLCKYYGSGATPSNSDCARCVLGIEEKQGCLAGTQYCRLADALIEWKNSDGSFSDYRVEQFKMVELLKKLKRENYGKCEKKAELRHGDYGYDYDGDPCMTLQLHDGGSGATLHKSNAGSAYAYTNKPSNSAFVPITKLGNIFDDLKRNSEDLERLEMNAGTANRSQTGKKLAIGFNNNGCLFVGVGRGLREIAHYTLDQATEIHQKLGQMIATIKRKKK